MPKPKKLTFSAEFSLYIPAERRALVECNKWVKLKKAGQDDELKAAQKQVLMAGMFIQVAAPELAHKLAANLDEANSEALVDMVAKLSNNKAATPDIEQLLQQQLESFEQRLQKTVQSSTQQAIESSNSNRSHSSPKQEPKSREQKTQVEKKATQKQPAMVSTQSEASQLSRRQQTAAAISNTEDQPVNVQEKVASMKSVRKRNIF